MDHEWTEDEAPSELETKTAGSGNYAVRQGECLSSIAFEHGFFWQTLWDLPDNAAVKKARGSPNVLLPGDRIAIPPLQQKEIDGATEARHRFKKRGVPAVLRLCFLEDGEARADERYAININGKWREGSLDSEGRLKETIPPDLRSVLIRIGQDPEFELPLGTVDPVSEISGVQGRLNNLGFSAGPIDNLFGPKTEAAIRRFQLAHGLKATGESDDQTRRKLEEVHGC